MNQFQSGSNLKNSAKNCMDGKWGLAALITLIQLGILAGVQIVFSVFANLAGLGGYLSFELYIVTYVIEYIVSFFAELLSSLLKIGCYYFCLNIVSRQRSSVGDLFVAFRSDPGKCLMVSLALTLPQTLFTIPYYICNFLYGLYGDYTMAAIMVLALVLGMAVYVPVVLALSMAPLLLMDFPQYSAKEVLQHSIRIMKGHKGRLFLIELSFLPLYILCVFTFGAGFLWLLPYLQMTYVLFYLDRMNPKPVESGTLFQAET